MEAAPLPPLPQRWTEAVDPDGRLYYVDQVTKTTKWEVRETAGGTKIGRLGVTRYSRAGGWIVHQADVTRRRRVNQSGVGLLFRADSCAKIRPKSVSVSHPEPNAGQHRRLGRH